MQLDNTYLHEKSSPVILPETQHKQLYFFCRELERVMQEKNGIGISAVQVGCTQQIFVAKDDKTKKNHYYVNCQYKPHKSRLVFGLEGCLSLPGRSFKVKRHSTIALAGYEITENEVIEFKNRIFYLPDSVVMQHEIDHQNGITIDMIGVEI